MNNHPKSTTGDLLDFVKMKVEIIKNYLDMFFFQNLVAHTFTHTFTHTFNYEQHCVDAI